MVRAAPHLNGLNWRTQRRMDLAHGAYDGVDEARTYFYSANWQVLEEHVDADLDGDIDRIGQQFWGVRYIDDAVAKRLDRDGDGDFTTDPGDNFFYLTDVMFSVRGVTDGSGVLHTRLDYTPYGVAMRSPAVDVTGNGLVDVFDLNAFMTVYNGGPGGTSLKPGDTGYDPDADLSGSGELDFFEFLAFQALYGVYGPGGSAPAFNDGWIDNPNDEHGPDNSVGYDGYWFDLAGATEATSTGLYTVRNRVYDPKLGRWVQRDPLEYVDGSSQYGYATSNPLAGRDPSGTFTFKDCPQHKCQYGFERNPAAGLPRANGCGAATLQRLFLKVASNVLMPIFGPCCDSHDLCYGTCGSNRDSCDKGFCKCLSDACNALPRWNPGLRIACKGQAAAYCAAVKQAGRKPFCSSQSRACMCSPCPLVRPLPL